MGDLNLSAQATREENLNFLYSIRDLAYKEMPCAVVNGGYAEVGHHPPVSLLINSDLKIRDWLVEQVLVIETGAAPISLQRNALTYKVDFDVVSSADINSIWRLARVSVNTNGTLFSGHRDRTDSLILTFGPADPSTKTLTGVAADQFFAEQIGASLSSQMVNVPP